MKSLAVTALALVCACGAAPSGETPAPELDAGPVEAAAAQDAAPHVPACDALSPRTVETYRERIMQKLGLEHRSQLVEYALRHNLLG